MEREAMPLLPSQGGRRAVSRRSAIVVAALAAVAVVAVAVLSRHGAPLALYQIGSKTFSQVARMSVEDMAADVRRMLAMEKKTLDSIDARAAKHQKVQVKLVAGQIGPKGPLGEKGYKGVEGFAGPIGNNGRGGNTGPEGDEGLQGIKGQNGVFGDQGDSGKDGDTGPKGPQGPAGRRGREGRRGPEGPMGLDGPPGKQGIFGEMGPPGLDRYNPGPPGPEGKQGPQGLAGRDGDNGLQGILGDAGPTGVSGADGAQGPNGLKGLDGKSRCEMATTIGKSVCCNVVKAEDIQQESSTVFYWDIDSASCGFEGTPKYFTSVKCVGMCGRISPGAVTNPKDPTTGQMDPTRFRIYVVSKESTTRDYLIEKQTIVKWCGVGDSNRRQPQYAMCCGGAGRGQWTHQYNSRASIKIDTRECGWKNSADAARMHGDAPYYFATASDSMCSSDLRSDKCVAHSMGTTSVYNPNQEGFDLHMWLPSNMRSGKIPKEANWNVDWCAFKPIPTDPDGRAGFPCTAARLLNRDERDPAEVPAQKQLVGVFSNSGEMCCGDSKPQWRAVQENPAYMFQDIDISQCGFTKIKYIMTSLRSDMGFNKLGGNTQTGAQDWSMTEDGKLRIYLAKNGSPIKFYDADAHHFSIQYCLAGR